MNEDTSEDSLEHTLPFSTFWSNLPTKETIHANRDSSTNIPKEVIP